MQENMSDTPTPTSTLDHQGAVLRAFASLLSTHLCNGITSPETRNKQFEQFPTLFDPEGLEVTVPSLEIDKIAHHNKSLEAETAERLSIPFTVHRLTELWDIPLRVLTNATATFETLWRARLRQSAAALRRSTYVEPPPIPTNLLSATVAEYQTPQYVNRAGENETVIPIVLQIVMDWNLNNAVTTLRMEAPGIVQGQFRDGKLVKAVLELDTSKLLASMMQQAKILAKASIAVYWQTGPPVSNVLPTIATPQPQAIRNEEKEEEEEEDEPFPGYKSDEKTPLEQLFDNDVMPPPKPRQQPEHHQPSSLDLLSAAAEQEAARNAHSSTAV